jgi:hypothetical protein
MGRSVRCRAALEPSRARTRGNRRFLHANRHRAPSWLCGANTHPNASLRIPSAALALLRVCCPGHPVARTTLEYFSAPPPGH